jgi:phenylacetate-CoA ligase
MPGHVVAVTGAPFRSATEGLLWPALPGRAGAELLAQLYQLEHTQYFPPQLLRARQLQQFSQLARHAAEACEFYRERFRQRPADVGLVGRGAPAPLGADPSVQPAWTWERFTSLPLLTRRELLTRAEGIHAQRVPPSHGKWREVQTSGSTGAMVAVHRTDVTQLLWFALTMRDHLWHQRDFRKMLAVIRANVPPQLDEKVAREQGWGAPVTLLHESGPCFTLPLSNDAAVLGKWLVENRPGYLLTYPTTLSALLDWFGETGQRLSALEHVRTIGETLSPALRARCKEVLGVPIVDVYSAQEVGVIAIQCQVSGLYHVQGESLIVEVLDSAGRACEQGQSGRVVVTDLHNFATPLIRYEIGDYAEVGPACRCGRGLPTLTRILGRERNLVVLPDGTRHWPLVGFHHFREVGQILQYQLIQHDLERVEMRLVTAGNLAAASEQRLIEIVQQALGHPFRIELSYVEGELERSAGGKFEEFISRVGS